jgi:hypothetical protein
MNACERRWNFSQSRWKYCKWWYTTGRMDTVVALATATSAVKSSHSSPPEKGSRVAAVRRKPKSRTETAVRRLSSVRMVR